MWHKHSVWFCRYSVPIGLKPSNEYSREEVLRKSATEDDESLWKDSKILIKNFVWDEQLNCKSYLLQRSFNPCLIKQLYKESNQHNKFPLCRLSRICKTKSEINLRKLTWLKNQFSLNLLGPVSLIVLITIIDHRLPSHY